MLEERCEDVIDERLEKWVIKFEEASNNMNPYIEIQHVKGKEKEVKEEDDELDEDMDEEFDFMDWLNDCRLKYEDDPYYRATRLFFRGNGYEEGFVFFNDGTIKYYYLHWYDSAVRTLYGVDASIMREVKDIIEDRSLELAENQKCV